MDDNRPPPSDSIFLGHIRIEREKKVTNRHGFVSACSLSNAEAVYSSHTYTNTTHRGRTEMLNNTMYARVGRKSIRCLSKCQTANRKEILLKPVDLIIITKENNDDGSLYSFIVGLGLPFFLLLICILARSSDASCPLT